MGGGTCIGLEIWRREEGKRKKFWMMGGLEAWRVILDATKEGGCWVFYTWVLGVGSNGV